MSYGLRSTFRRAFMGMVIVPILLAAVGTTLVVGQFHLDSEYSRLQELALRVAGTVQGEMRHGESVLEALQHYRDLAQLSPESQEALLAEMVVRERMFHSVILVDAAGQEQARASNAAITTPGVVSSRAGDRAFQKVMRTRSVHYGPTRFDETASAPLLEVAVPVMDFRDDRVEGVLIAEVRLRSLWQLLAQVSPGAGTQVYLVDDGDRVIAHANPSVVLRGTEAPARDAGRFDKGLNDHWVLWTARVITLGEREYRIIAERYWALAAKPVLGTLVVLIVVLAVALVASVFAGSAVRSRVVKPVLTIEQTARSIADGDLSRRVDIDADNELGILAGSFNQMTDQLQQTLHRLRREIDVHQLTQKDLQRTRDTLRSVIDTVPIAVFWKDRESRYLGCNALFAREVAEDTPDDVIGKFDTELVWVDNAADFVADDLQVINSGKPKLGFEECLTQEDGSLRWVRTSKVPLRDELGEVIGVLGVYADITEQKAAREELRSLNQELEMRVEERTAELTRLNKELESFSYSVSHDLRTPLRALDGFAQLLNEDYGSKLDEDGRHYLKRIRAAAQRMGKLIDDMLMLSRVSRRELSYTTVDLSILSRDILRHLEQADPDRLVQTRIAEGLVVQGDRNLLRIALDNLLGNAWKYTSKKPQAQITVGAEEHEGETVYFVRDNGVGFDMQYSNKLFESFQRLHSVEDYPGTGIGLATVKRVIQRHSGRVWAQAEPDKGATFYFTLGSSAAVPPPPLAKST